MHPAVIQDITDKLDSTKESQTFKPVRGNTSVIRRKCQNVTPVKNMAFKEYKEKHDTFHSRVVHTTIVALERCAKEELKYIRKMIVRAASRGETYCIIPNPIMVHNEIKLEAEGFEICWIYLDIMAVFRLSFQ